MVAGATGIDLFLLVIDAGEGARPQTHEHLAILRLLGIEHGVVAVTKADAVDEETLELALEEARELVPEAEVVAVSAKTGAGLDELRAALAPRARSLCSETQARRPGAARLYVDRVFSLRGIGTVATGTLWSGTVAEGDVLRAEPAGRDVRVRSVQVHDRAGRAGRGGPAGRARTPGRRAERAAPRRRAHRAGQPRGRATGSTSRSRSSSRSRTARAFTSITARPPSPPASSASATLRAATAGARRSSRHAATGSSSATRRPSAAAPCSTRAPPRHADPARFERPGAARRTVDAPALVDGEWRFSRRVAGRARGRARSASSTRPTRSIPASPRRPSRGRRTCSPGSRSSGAARCSTGRARAGALGARDAEAERLLERRACRGGARRGEGGGRGARPLPRAGRQARPRSATAGR